MGIYDLPTPTTALFNERFQLTIENLITQHHTIYPSLPPQGIYFEYIVLRAFHLSGSVDAKLVQSSPNAATYDLMVTGAKITIKSETGKSTKQAQANITKLCTTEREPWDAQTLVARVLQHLARYDRMLMLRAIWSEKAIRYQLLEIPLVTLRLIGAASPAPTGHRRGRQSLSSPVADQAGVAFNVFFDGADGKCQVRNLKTDRCTTLREWDQRL